MKNVLIIFTLTVIGVFSYSQDTSAQLVCDDPHCYALEIHRQNFVDGLKYDLAAPDLWIDRNACNDIAVSTGWLISTSNSEWVEAGITKGSLRNLDGTITCVTQLSTYYAYNFLKSDGKYSYIEFLVPNGRVDTRDDVNVKIQQNDQNQIRVHVNTPDRLDEFASARITLQPNNNYYADFGIEGTVSAPTEYSSIPMSKYTNTKILRNDIWIDLPNTTTLSIPTAGQGYKAMKCPNNSFIAGTVTALDCNNVATRNQVPIFGNIVRTITTNTPITIPLMATDTDKDYLTYKLVSSSTHGTTDHTNRASPISTTNGETSQIVYTPTSNTPESDTFRVSVTDKRVGHTKESLVSITGPTSGPTISDAIDDLSHVISGNTITLSWSHPFNGGSEITSYRIERSVDTNTWSLVNTISETLTSYDITSSPGSIQYYRILVNNANGPSASSNIVQPYIIDNTPPVITISTPTTNQIITSQNIPVTSNIFEYDNSGIENVQMLIDHVIITNPISVLHVGGISITATSEITGVDNGQHTLTVRATNGDGYIANQSVSFTKNTPTSQNLSSFEDNFDENNISSNWHTTTEDDEYWDIRTPIIPVPDSTLGNEVAGVEDCDDKCELIMIHTVDISTMAEPKLNFYRYLSSSLDNGEGLDVDISTDGGVTFITLDSFTADESEDDGIWHFEEYSLANYTSTQFKLKFIATSSSNSEDIEIDNLRIYDAYIPTDTTISLIIESINDITISEGQTHIVTVSATTTDQSPITYSLTQKPSFVTITNNTITISPDYYNAGNYTITAQAISKNQTSTVPFDVTVYDSQPTGYLSATVDNYSSILEVVEGEPFIVKFQYSENLSKTGWVCFEMIDSDGNKVKKNADIKLWNDPSQYSFDGVSWGGDSYNDKVFYGTCKYITGDQLWLSIPTFVDYDETESDEVYYLKIREDRNNPQFEPKLIPLTIKESGRGHPVITVDVDSSTLVVTEGESFVVSFQYDYTLSKTEWASFDVIDSDGNKVRDNENIKLWNDPNLFSYDNGIKWGGPGYYDKVYYGSYKYILGDSISVKIPTKINDDVTQGDKTYKLKVTVRNNEATIIFPQVDLTIQDR
ncbi:MAG: hypothetical protein HRU07_04545 [Nitrosopumilus sp.]|nr:fibronectin type III domain-containing protein [Nitrosopumilus sp.]NRA05422.1 hypothetical protein [Nitrosopumilus sp.]